MSQSIFHQTVLCQTQTVAEHQSKVRSFPVSVNRVKKNLALRTNFRGNRLCVRKCKLAMGKHRHVDAIPRAVLTTNPASEVCSNHHNIITSFQSDHYYYIIIIIIYLLLLILVLKGELIILK